MSNARLRAPLERRLVGTLSLVSIPPVGLIVAYVLALVRLPDEQLWIFLQNAALGAALVFAPYTAMFSRMYRRIDAAVDACLAGDPDPGTTADAFRDLVDLPRFLFVRGVCMWFGASTLVVAATLARADDLSAFTAFALFAGMVSGGFVLEVFLALVAKRIAEPERLILARFAGGPEQRASLVQPLRLERKLRVSLVGVLLVTIGFALQFAQARAARSVESAITQVQHRLLDELPADAPPSAISRLGAQAVRLGVANEIVVIGASGRGEGPLRPLERAAIEDSGAERGDGSGFDSSHVHAWRRLADGRVVVLAQPWRSVAGGVAVDRFGFALVLLVSAAVAVLLARLLASDVSRALRFLDARAQALAEGDLRQADVFESEDELGALARRFEGMAASLRGMVSGVAATAERLDLAASALGESSDGVAEGTAQQLQAIRRAGASTERILGSVGGIASSAEALTGSVEDSASTVHELGAVGGQLGTTAGELSGKVDSVSSAVEQMAASIREVARSADALAEASTDTSSSMEAMASSLGEVESNAGEAAELSSRAVAAAERGRERVAETVAGMEEIRGETEMARQVIGELGTRAEEIGGILEVIRDVADETSLLALNAAIISAQAGEHGRAFAVVADQIKALADRVLVSTREIEERIRGVQSQTSNAVAAIERGVESVHVGVERSQEAGQSLGEITGAAREAGSRIDGIVTAMREQSSAAGHVVKRMEEVETGAERIRRASREQDRGNELILNETVDMRSAALRVQRTTDEQQAGTARIRDAFEGVRLAVEQISEALRQQQEACAEASGQLDEMGRRSDDNQASVARSNAALRELRGDAEALRAEVRRFRL